MVNLYLGKARVALKADSSYHLDITRLIYAETYKEAKDKITLYTIDWLKNKPEYYLDAIQVNEPL